MDRKFKGVFIPREIWENMDTTSTEKILWGEIWSLSDNIDGCYASNSYLANFIGVNVRHLQKLLSNLEKKKFIRISENSYGQRRIYTFVSNDTPPVINDTPPVINDTHIYNTLYGSNTLLNNSSYYLKEKEEEKFINSVEELKTYLPWKKIQDEIPYKNIEREMIDFFIYHEDKGKKIPKSTVSLRFGHWIRPKYETENDRKQLMYEYNKKMAQKQAIKNFPSEDKEKQLKREIEPIESILETYSEEELEKNKKESLEKFLSLKIKTGDEKNKILLQNIFFENFMRKKGKKSLIINL